MDNKSRGPEATSAKWFSTEIYFGRNIPAGGEISEQQFAEFLSNEITPLFPAGLTIYDAFGQMQRSNREIVKQKTKVVVLVHKNLQADAVAIDKIIGAYRSRFGNPQVMLLTKQVEPVYYGD